MLITDTYMNDRISNNLVSCKDYRFKMTLESEYFDWWVTNGMNCYIAWLVLFLFEIKKQSRKLDYGNEVDDNYFVSLIFYFLKIFKN